jgi:radical SAM family uncharacterized protein/radical SAM-linked protein
MQHPYASFLHLVQKPGRYAGGEHGARPKDWTSVDARVCLAFPDVYDIGMSHLGFKILYKVLNDDPRTLAERAYCPWIDMESELRKRSLPLVSLESKRPLRDFDVVGFSLQFELTYSNVLTMLDLGGIPIRSSDRKDDDPLVIAGGPTATHPEPLSAFIDAFCIGDGEELARAIALVWTSHKALPRIERLRKISELQGVYVPALRTTHVDPDTGFVVVDGPRVSRALVASLDAFPFPDDGPVGGPEAIFDRMSIEIARGCTEGCRFCQAGMIYRPVRERSPDEVVGSVLRAIDKSGWDEVSLTSLSTADYSCIAPLVEKVVKELTPRRISLGVSSLRAYGLGEDTLDDIQRVRAAGLTFAPEAGSQRMRDVVNKNVTEAQLMETAERVFSRGFASMKLYFMIGLPTEEESDVREIVRVGKRARDVGKKLKKNPKVTVSVSTHVPKPHTPFQWCAMDMEADVRKKQSWLSEEQRGSGVELRMHDSEGSFIEGIFARGDRTLCDVLEHAWRAGARFDSWEDQLKVDLWIAALDACAIDPRRFLGTIPVTARLPWSHIDVGLEDGFLLSEYRKSLKSRLSPPCGKVAGQFVHATNVKDAEAEQRRLVCYDCGVACDLGAMKSERLVFLRTLGASEPRTEHGPQPAPPRGEARRYRFGYTKLGPSALLSHLDLVRAIPRAFRRIGVPMTYSQGFHPKPDMTFGPALSLGVHSIGEIVDVRLDADIDPSSLLERLSAECDEGLRFWAGARLAKEDPALSRVIGATEYALVFAHGVIEEAELARRIDEFLAKPEAKIVRRIEGVGKTIDVRRYVQSARVGIGDVAARAGIDGELVGLRVLVEVTAGGSAKISEVAEVLGLSQLAHIAVRTALHAKRGAELVSPFSLAELRVTAREPSVSPSCS